MRILSCTSTKFDKISNFLVNDFLLCIQQYLIKLFYPPNSRFREGHCNRKKLLYNKNQDMAQVEVENGLFFFLHYQRLNSRLRNRSVAPFEDYNSRKATRLSVRHAGKWRTVADSLSGHRTDGYGSRGGAIKFILGKTAGYGRHSQALFVL